LPIHRHHLLALASPVIAFLVLVFLPWNPIYPGIIAMAVGAVAAILCRPDLKTRTWVGGVLFLIYYAILLQGLRLLSPGYIERVWNLQVLIGTKLFSLPLGLPGEELLFAAFFGMYWSGVYEHLTWRSMAPRTHESVPNSDRNIRPNTTKLHYEPSNCSTHLVAAALDFHDPRRERLWH